MAQNSCESCTYYTYDEDFESFMCDFNLDEDEFIELGAYTIEELKEKIFSGEIEDAKTVSSLMAYAVKYGK